MTLRRPLVALNGGAAEIPTGDAVPLTSGGTGAITAAGALANLGLNATGAVSFRQRVINGNFGINQRGVSGSSTSYPASPIASSIGLDHWKAGSGGVTMSFAASGVDNVVTITAGTLVQAIEGALYLPEGGSYTLSWTGTAQARVNSGSYAASPIVASGLSAGANATIEFGTGTVSLVQFEPGGTATLFERRPASIELALAQRHFRRLRQPPLRGGTNGGTSLVRMGMALTPPMYAMPGAILNGTLMAIVPGVGTGTVTAIGANNCTTDVAEFDLTLSSSLGTAGQAAAIYQSGTGSIDLVAEIT